MSYEGEIPENETRVLSIFVKNGLLGAGCYSIETGELFVLSDQCLDEPKWDIFRGLLRQTNPDYVLVPSSGEAGKFVKSFVETENLNEEISVRGLASSVFNYSDCKNRILGIRFAWESISPFSEEKERHLYVSSSVNLTLEGSVRAVGGLLKFLEKDFLNQHGGNFEVSQISRLTIPEVLCMNRMTFEALKIFESSQRPSGSNAGKWNRCKEGLSVFKLLNKCRSSLGVKALENLLRCPPKKFECVLARQKTINYFVRPEQVDLAKDLRTILRGIKSVPGVVKRISNMTASVQDWKNLKKTVDHLLRIDRLCTANPSGIEVLEEYARNVEEDLFSLSHFLDKLFDIEESEIKYRFIVKSGVDEELDSLRRKHDGLPTLLTSVAELEVKDLGDLFEECSVIYFPRAGYMLALKPAYENLSEDEIKCRFSGLEFLFKTNETLHFKSERCRQLDHKFGDTDADIKSAEFRIIHKLSMLVLSMSSCLNTLTILAGQIDCFLSIAIVSKENSWIRPEILANEEMLFIENGRHPLQELCVQTYVPNSTSLDKSKICVLTGPNGSGKSVYLKQVGIIAFLAHIGSWVPATKATIPLLDRIDTRIQASESVSLGLSAFAIDLYQIKSAMSTSSKNCMVLIDEFGKGTADVDGEALLISSLEYFLSLKNHCPFILVATHFHKVYHHFYKSSNIRFLTPEYLQNKNGITYLYKISEGANENSCFNHVARNADIPDNIIKRAEDIASGKMQTSPNFVYPEKWEKKISMFEKLGRIIMDMDIENANPTDLLELLKM